MDEPQNKTGTLSLWVEDKLKLSWTECEQIAWEPTLQRAEHDHRSTCSATSEPSASSAKLVVNVILYCIHHYSPCSDFCSLIFISLQFYWSPFCRLRLLNWWHLIDLLAPYSLFLNERYFPRNPPSFLIRKLYLMMLIHPISRGTTICHFAVRQLIILKLFTYWTTYWRQLPYFWF